MKAVHPATKHKVSRKLDKARMEYQHRAPHPETEALFINLTLVLSRAETREVTDSVEKFVDHLSSTLV